MPQIYLSLDVSYLQVNFGQAHLRCLNLLSDVLRTDEVSNQEELADPGLPPEVAAVTHSFDDLRAGSFTYVTVAGELRDVFLSIVLDLCEAAKRMTRWWCW